MEKVKAHVTEFGDEDRLSDPVERLHARGNNWADHIAKRGLHAHPGLTRNEAEAIGNKISKLKRVACCIAQTCELWPSARECNGGRLQSQSAMPTGRPRGEGATQRKASVLDSRWHSIKECIIEDGVRLLVCTSCAGWGQTRMVKLGRHCKGRPRGTGRRTKDAQRILARVAEGWHPQQRKRIRVASAPGSEGAP